MNIHLDSDLFVCLSQFTNARLVNLVTAPATTIAIAPSEKKERVS